MPPAANPEQGQPQDKEARRWQKAYLHPRALTTVLAADPQFGPPVIFSQPRGSPALPPISSSTLEGVCCQAQSSLNNFSVKGKVPVPESLNEFS